LYVERLHLVNFRNYRESSLEFSPGVQLIVGKNGQGKTNLLEAVYYLSRFKPRPFSKPSDLIHHGQPYFAVGALVYSEHRRVVVKVMVGRGVKNFSLDGEAKGSASELRGLVKTVMFSPEDVMIVSGEPYLRRNFLDSAIEIADAGYGLCLKAYRHALVQRNSILGKWERYGQGLPRVLEPWDLMVAENGSYILTKRVEFIQNADKVMKENYPQLSGHDYSPTLTYWCSIRGKAVRQDQNFTQDEYLSALNESRSEDLNARCTTKGPHRDDFRVSFYGKDAGRLLSQGEKRTVAYCLRMAEERYIYWKTGQNPILLLDDVISELDEERAGRLTGLGFPSDQVFITDTRVDRVSSFNPEGIIRVEGGVARVERA